mmetsp:Transcript_45911/g.107235  ORF Transcript_45911/g.107235 Transcript_45911/m.107235 type:complete len:210 (+) Transcript_45911:90-719(+)
MPASGDKTCLCGTTVQAKHYTRHLGRCDKYKDVQSRAQGTVFRAHVEDTDAIEDADDMDDSLGDGHDVGLHASKRARPVAQPVGGLGAHVPGLRIMPMHGCTPLLPAAGGPAAGGGTISEQLRAASSRQATSTHTLLNALSNQVSNMLLAVGRLPMLVASAIPAAFGRFEDDKSARQEAAAVGPTLAAQLRLCRSVAEVVRLDAGLCVD